ncbi:MAG: class I SAM-dependent methyltransferase [candidate division Zixibacteria bacterium]|nr:class I SAM-dependent methyltransferase [Candidatus Tariuqbacter arcticus]
MKNLIRRLKERYFRKHYPPEFIELAAPMGMDLLDFIQHYGGLRNDVLKLIPASVKRVLDVGCASGFTGEVLKSRGIETVVGVELEPTIAQFARQRLDDVIVGDVERIEIPYPDGYFDLIMYNDILEHLIDPWELVKKHSRLLSENGRFMIGFPNVRHFLSLLNILKGGWDYQEIGLFAKIHLRFFTLKNVKKDILAPVGHKVDKVWRHYRLFRRTSLFKTAAKLLSLYIFRDFFVYQYVILSKSEDYK